jgi:DNA-binding NarL/FixJ family response regulator
VGFAGMANDGVKTLFNEDEFAEIAEELSLSPRESQIVRDILLGSSDKQIARNLEMAIPTVRTHMQRIFSKLDVHDKYGLIVHVFSTFRKNCYSKGCPRILSSEQMTS